MSDSQEIFTTAELRDGEAPDQIAHAKGNLELLEEARKEANIETQSAEAEYYAELLGALLDDIERVRDLAPAWLEPMLVEQIEWLNAAIDAIEDGECDEAAIVERARSGRSA